jgi:hypothetical protein
MQLIGSLIPSPESPSILITVFSRVLRSKLDEDPKKESYTGLIWELHVPGGAIDVIAWRMHLLNSRDDAALSPTPKAFWG